MLELALRTFARRGCRKTSMDGVAQEARISRPGAYLCFPSNQSLLAAAVDQVLSKDVAQAEALLEGEQKPL